MNQITHKNITLNYVIRRTTKSKIYLRVKDGVVVVSATKRTTIKDVESIIIKHFDYLVELIKKHEKQNVIHINGLSYVPKFYLGDKPKVILDNGIIYICAKKNDSDEYKKVLYKYFKEVVEREILSLIPEIKLAFPNTIIPEIKVNYYKSMFGNYNRKNHTIKISSMLARYDKEYIRLVLYHEMCHIYEFNHSKNYYALFESKYPNAKRKNFELKKIKYNDYI